MPTSAQLLSGALAQLQREANRCARAFESYRYAVELRVFHVHGDRLPWRLMETHRRRNLVVLRRMHFFANPLSLAQCLKELRAWKARNRALVTSQLPMTRKALVSNEWDSAHMQAKDPWVSLCLDLDALEEERRELKRRCCVTGADRVVDLQISSRRR